MKVARAGMQLSLFPHLRPSYVITTNAHARNAYGQAVQEIVCAALGLDPIAIDGSKEVCFDAERDGVFYEIKSVHRHGKLVIYDWRMEKEARAGVTLVYALLVHSVRGARTSDNMWHQFQSLPLELWTLPYQVVHEVALRCPLSKIKASWNGDPRNGYNRKGYRNGYRNLGLSSIRGLMVERSEPQELTLFDQRFSIVRRVL